MSALVPGPTGEVGIVAALCAVMAEIGGIGKGGVMDAGRAGSYSYRKIDDILDAAQPLLAQHGVLPVPRALAADYDTVTTRNGNSMRQATIPVEYAFIHTDGSMIVAETVGEALDTGDKATNKAFTAAFKIALSQVLALGYGTNDDQDDDRPERGDSRSGSARAESGGPTCAACGESLAGQPVKVKNRQRYHESCVPAESADGAGAAASTPPEDPEPVSADAEPEAPAPSASPETPTWSADDEEPF